MSAYHPTTIGSAILVDGRLAVRVRELGDNLNDSISWRWADDIARGPLI